MGSQQRRRIILVDDSQVTRILLTERFQREFPDAEVTAYGSWIDALIDNRIVDLAVLDVLTGESSWHTIGKILELLRVMWRGCGFILYTGIDVDDITGLGPETEVIKKGRLDELIQGARRMLS